MHRRFRWQDNRGVAAEIYIGIHNSWRWESWSKDGAMHMMVEGYPSEDAAVAASPCSKHKRLAYEELCRISFNPAYAWLIIDADTGEVWGRNGFDSMSEAEINARAWLRAGRPQQQEAQA